MESAKIYGSEEDCRSCESGWTMYLASQSHDNEDDCYYDDYDDEEEDSDGGDSMDSDASSGPMEATSCLKPLQEIEEQNSIKKKKKKTNEEMVLVETTRVHNTINDDDDDDNDDDGDDHYNDDGNDSYSVVHSYVGSVRREGDVYEELRRDHSTDTVMKVADDDSLGLLRCTSMPSIMGSLWSP